MIHPRRQETEEEDGGKRGVRREIRSEGREGRGGGGRELKEEGGREDCGE